MSKKPEIKIEMVVSLKEANLVKKIRQIKGSGEFLLVVKSGLIDKVKYSTIVYTDDRSGLMDFDRLAKLIAEKVPFGEVTVLTRQGWPYAISSTINYDDLSDGL